jgi:hypothetical protein
LVIAISTRGGSGVRIDGLLAQAETADADEQDGQKIPEEI